MASLLSDTVPSQMVLGALLLLGAAILAEAYPVPVEGVSAGGVSLAASFLVGAALIYDWETATILGFLTRATIEVIQRRPMMRLAYNSATYALASATAGWLVHVVGPGDGAGRLLGAVALASVGFYVVNVTLVGLVVARASGVRFDDILVQSVRWTAVPFAIMGSLSVILAVLWDRSHYLVGALVGPLVAVALYQRSVQGELEALRLAKTDPLTGLGNHRAFHERLHEVLRELDDEPVTLALLDVDGFKRVNDQLGHHAGDKLLSALARVMPDAGDAYRIGGDEFAIIVGASREVATDRLELLVRTVEGLNVPGIASVTISAGLAAHPFDALGTDALFQAADAALYRAKQLGKNRVSGYDPGVAAPTDGREKHSLRLRMAWKLAELVDDAKMLEADPFAGHPGRVADLAARVAKRLDFGTGDVELIRLAAQLHDVGKLAVPREILVKPEELSCDERDRIGQHPEVGQQILAAIGANPIADWVLAHHERWDGAGYPRGLAGDAIPLPSRIIFVADAFDAMTSDRPYRDAISEREAIDELRRCAGTQFDPAVVEALAAELELDIVRAPKLVRVA
ncbi:MAG: diguanylate cyclase [Gaiellales bacterium]